MNGRKKVGLILILIGIFLIVDRLQVVDFGALFKLYWPSIFVVIGIYDFFEKRRISATGLSFVAIGAILQIWHLDLLPGEFKEYIWPTILIIIGISLIFTQKVATKKNNFRTDKFIDYFTILSGLETINASDDFRGGSITAILGGAEVDLSQAKIRENSAEISVTAVMGGVDLKVPKDWKVVANGLPLLGGWDNKTFVSPEQTKIVYVKCTAIMGGIEIKN